MYDSMFIKTLLLCSLFTCTVSLQAQTLTQKLTGTWELKDVLNTDRKPLRGEAGALKMVLHKDSTYQIISKAMTRSGRWSIKDSMLYLRALPATDSLKNTQVLRIIDVQPRLLELYAGVEKGNEIRFIYTRRRKK